MPALAQRFHVHNYTEMEGLPSGQVHGLEQAEDGRIWFSTRLGVVAYDGARWEPAGDPFGTAPGLLEYDDEGGLWVVPRNRPLILCRYADGAWTRFPEAGVNVGSYGLLSLLPIDGDTVFVGTAHRGLAGWVDGAWRRCRLGGELEFTAFALARRGNEIFVGADTGLWQIDLTDLERPAMHITGIPAGEVRGLLFEDETLWTAGQTWTGKLEDDVYTSVHVGEEPFVPYGGSFQLALDANGGLYIAHANRIAYLDAEGELSELDHSNGLIETGATDVEVDREGNVWIATMRGVSKVVTRGIETYTKAHDLYDNEVSAILERPDGTVLLGHNGGLSLFDGRRVESLDFQEGPLRGRVMDLEEGDDNQVWVGSTGLGLGRFTPGLGVEWFELPIETQVHAVAAADEQVWIGTTNGVWIFSDGVFRPLEGDPIFGRPVRRMLLADDGSLYAATMGDGVWCRQPDGELERWFTGDYTFDNTYTMLRCADGRLLVGSQRGMLEGRDGKLVPSTEYPIDNPVYLLAEDVTREAIWIGTGRGVVHATSTGMRWIGPSDGLAGPETNRDAGLIDDRGRFWVGTDRGLSIVLPTVNLRSPPTVTLLTASHAGTAIDLENASTRVTPQIGPLVWSFRSTAFIDERRTRFRHRLEGLNEEWVGPVEVPTRELTYSALPAGTYRLHLQAIGADGRESPVIVSPSVIIPAQFYERLWFRMGLAVLGLGAAWGLIAQRVQRAYARQLEDQVQRRTAQLEESEHNLADDRERLAAMLSSIADGVTATDDGGRIILWNRAAERVTGRAKDDVLGHDLHTVLGVEQPLPRHGVLQFEALTASGERRMLEASSAPLGTAGAVVAFRDLTDRLALERDMARTQRLESLGLLAGGIAHDFNNYLTVIIGTLGMLREESTLSTAQRDQVRVAEQTMNRAVSLTQQLLTFSTGGAPVTKDVALDELMQDAVAFALSGSNVIGRIELEPDVRRAHVDPGQIAQVLHNLLLNARQAMPEGGSITLRARDLVDPPDDLGPGPWVAIEVEDHGPGIPPELQARIFDPFFSAREGGTGLGLAIAHSIVSRHGGRISVDSTWGHGTSFVMLLPAATSKPTVVVPPDPVATPRAARVLVMDDEESIRTLIARILERLGHSCEVVEEGTLAIARYAEAQADGEPFDLVLLDLTIIDGMGGKETARHLLELDPDARLVAASGYSNDAVLSDHASYGFCAALAKPFRLNELREVLGRVLNATPGAK